MSENKNKVKTLPIAQTLIVGLIGKKILKKMRGGK